MKTIIEKYETIDTANTGELLAFLKETFPKETLAELKRLSYTWYLYEMHVFAKIQLGLLPYTEIIPRLTIKD